MNKLKNKTFTLLVSILTTFSLIIVIIYNITIYNNEYNNLRNKLIAITNTHEKYITERNNYKNPIFMDMEVYVVSFDIFGKVKKINNYANDGLSENEIIKLVGENISKYKIGEIKNLYLNKYIFSLNNSLELIIINNINIQKYLISNLYKSIIIFLILELIIIYTSNYLTKWLTKPVEETFNKQKQFIYDASHELKTPISIILASAETLEENPKEKKWLENIKSESERMITLVKKLLELSRTEEIEEIYKEENLSKIIENKALTFESLMFEQKLTLELNIEKNIYTKCNQDRIKELLSILVDNAIKHGYQNTKIKINLYKNKNNINLEVKNKGDEITKEDQQKIFERFYRVDKSRNRDSNRYGLGLAIAKNIVEKHNGTINVDCKNGYTTFTVTIKQN